MNIDAVNQFIGRDWVYRENDCWSVLRDAARAVFGIEIPDVPDMPETSDPSANVQLFNAGAQSPNWHRVDDPVPGCAVLFFSRSGRPVHVGLYVEGGNVLHCPGSPTHPGRTVYERLRELRTIYHDLRFYEYAPRHDH